MPQRGWWSAPMPPGSGLEARSRAVGGSSAERARCPVPRRQAAQNSGPERPADMGIDVVASHVLPLFGPTNPQVSAYRERPPGRASIAIGTRTRWPSGSAAVVAIRRSKGRGASLCSHLPTAPRRPNTLLLAHRPADRLAPPRGADDCRVSPQQLSTAATSFASPRSATRGVVGGASKSARSSSPAIRRATSPTPAITA
jgi:hypothetical protein